MAPERSKPSTVVLIAAFLQVVLSLPFVLQAILVWTGVLPLEVETPSGSGSLQDRPGEVIGGALASGLAFMELLVLGVINLVYLTVGAGILLRAWRGSRDEIDGVRILWDSDPESEEMKEAHSVSERRAAIKLLLTFVGCDGTVTAEEFSLVARRAQKLGCRLKKSDFRLYNVSEQVAAVSDAGLRGTIFKEMEAVAERRPLSEREEAIIGEVAAAWDLSPPDSLGASLSEEEEPEPGEGNPIVPVGSDRWFGAPSRLFLGEVLFCLLLLVLALLSGALLVILLLDPVSDLGSAVFILVTALGVFTLGSEAIRVRRDVGRYGRVYRVAEEGLLVRAGSTKTIPWGAITRIERRPGEEILVCHSMDAFDGELDVPEKVQGWRHLVDAMILACAARAG